MMGSKHIKTWVICASCLWLLSTLIPTISVYTLDASDQMTMTGTLEEEPNEEKEEKKEEHKKEWISPHSKLKYAKNKINFKGFNAFVTKYYSAPVFKILIPPPEFLS